MNKISDLDVSGASATAFAALLTALPMLCAQQLPVLLNLALPRLYLMPVRLAHAVLRVPKLKCSGCSPPCCNRLNTVHLPLYTSTSNRLRAQSRTRTKQHRTRPLCRAAAVLRWPPPHPYLTRCWRRRQQPSCFAGGRWWRGRQQPHWHRQELTEGAEMLHAFVA
jgi:hypothetical protein